MGEGGDEEVTSGCVGGRGQADCMFVHNSGHPQFFLYLHVACKETGKVNLKNIHLNDHKLYRGLFLKISMSVSKTFPYLLNYLEQSLRD